MWKLLCILLTLVNFVQALGIGQLYCGMLRYIILESMVLIEENFLFNKISFLGV